MKKLLSLILLFSLSFTFYSCDKDDDKEKEGEPKPFVWGGDWNDPEDENYKPEYEGKYNPIQGLWKRVNDPSYGFYYSEDFKGYLVYFYPNGGYVKELMYKESYQINDEAFRYSEYAPDYVKYRKKGDMLYTGSRHASDDQMIPLVSIIEKD